jgi:hypothetical protein
LDWSTVRHSHAFAATSMSRMRVSLKFSAFSHAFSS